MDQKVKPAFHQVYEITVWIALFAVLLTCTGQGGKFVICLGEDGHIAIETVTNGQCECNRHVYATEITNVSIQNEIVFLLYHNHFDIPIFMYDIGNFITQEKYIVINNRIPSLFDTTFINHYFDKIIHEVLIIESPPDINPALVSIRTVISLS